MTSFATALELHNIRKLGNITVYEGIAIPSGDPSRVVKVDAFGRSLTNDGVISLQHGVNYNKYSD